MGTTGISSGVSRKAALVLAAALTVALAISLGNVAESSGSGPQAVTAKKKCKKKGKKSAVVAKKKCKKKTTATPAPVPVPAPSPPSPTVRATLTWNTDADLDLYVWDTGGVGGPGGGGIGSTSFSGDDTNGFGPESFSDLLSPSSRQFTYGVCVFDASTTPTDWTLTVRYANGTSDVWTEDDAGSPFANDGDWFYVRWVPEGYDPGDGGPDPPNWCFDESDIP